MEILTAMHTDVGIKKKTNQDSLLLKIADTSVGKVALAMICDGMGGLSQGEKASATVIEAFSNWFETELPFQLAKNDIRDIQYRWDRLIKDLNQQIGQYAKNRNTQLGTTWTAVLLIDDRTMLIGHVGDTRVYRITDRIELVTEDQTVVAREIKRGRLTPEQAKTDPRRHVLLQCIGASKTVQPDFYIGRPERGEVLMLCSDGFRHKISESEILAAFSPTQLLDEITMKQKAVELVELNKMRQETDNITVLLMKIL